MGFPAKSKMDGSCKKDSTHTWKVGDSIYMHKKDDGTWLVCSNQDCFKSQGGIIEEKQSKGQGRSLDMCIAFARGFDGVAAALAKERTDALFKDLDSVAATKDKDVIFKKAEIYTKIYQTLVMAFNGK